MTFFTPQNLVHVYYRDLGDKHLIGRLFLRNRQIFFEYDADFCKFGLELSPFKLPLKTGIIASDVRIFDGLFGVFNDSLPDGWTGFFNDICIYIKSDYFG